jgi:hypothetical protein
MARRYNIRNGAAAPQLGPTDHCMQNVTFSFKAKARSARLSEKNQIPPDLVVKSQAVDITKVI